MMISVFDKVENIVGKGENTGNQHFLLFPECFSMPSFLGRQKSRLCGCSDKTLYYTIPTLTTLGEVAFSPFPTVFSTVPKTNFSFTSTCIFIYKYFEFGRISDFGIRKSDKFMFRPVEIIVDKGENAGYQYFLISPINAFKRLFSQGYQSSPCVVKGSRDFH